MKPTLALTLITALLSVQAMESAPTGQRNPSEILKICDKYRSTRLHAWTEGQLRMCIKAAAECNESAILNNLLSEHLLVLRHQYRIGTVTCILPNLVVACSVDDHVDVLRVLLSHYELSSETLKAAFIRAAASGAYSAVHTLLETTGGISSSIGTEAILEASHAGNFYMCQYLLTKVQYDEEHPQIILIKALGENIRPGLNKNVIGSKNSHETKPDVQNEGALPILNIGSSEAVASGWSFWGTVSSLTQMVTDAAYRVYNGIPAFITYDKKEVDEFFAEAQNK